MSQVKKRSSKKQAPPAKRRVAGSVIPSLGDVVDARRTTEMPQDVKGKYLGNNTHVNVEKGLFNTKHQVRMTAAWATALNALSNTSPDQQNVTGIAFDEDMDAELTVSRDGRHLVPGSAAQMQSPTSVGLMFIRNPVSGHFIRVGGPGYTQLLVSSLLRTTNLSEVQEDKLIGQGYRYGLMVPLKGLGFKVSYKNKVYKVDTPAFDDVRDVRKVIKAYYDTHLVNPDDQVRGRFGAASLFRDHADRTSAGTGAKVIADYETHSGSIAGLGYKWKQGSNKPKDRLGLSAFPLRNADGVALDGRVNQARMRREKAHCTIAGAGPGVGGNGKDEFQFRFSRRANQHKTHSFKKAYGEPASQYIIGKNGKYHKTKSNVHPTYSCGPTNADVVNPSRNIYQANPGTQFHGKIVRGQDRAAGARAGNGSLRNDLDAISRQLQDPSVSSTALQNRYNTWKRTAPGRDFPAEFAGDDGGFNRKNAVGQKAIYNQFVQQRSNQYLDGVHVGKAGPAATKQGRNVPGRNVAPLVEHFDQMDVDQGNLIDFSEPHVQPKRVRAAPAKRHLIPPAAPAKRGRPPSAKTLAARAATVGSRAPSARNTSVYATARGTKNQIQ